MPYLVDVYNTYSDGSTLQHTVFVDGAILLQEVFEQARNETYLFRGIQTEQWDFPIKETMTVNPETGLAKCIHNM